MRSLSWSVTSTEQSEVAWKDRSSAGAAVPSSVQAAATRAEAQSTKTQCHLDIGNSSSSGGQEGHHARRW